jgi:uncharacterized protein (TIGR02647 family)
MPYTPELVDELRMLSRYNLANIDAGLKAHHTADAAMIAAMRRLHAKGLVTQEDGGYLTDLGREAAEHAQAALTILTSLPALGQ